MHSCSWIYISLFLELIRGFSNHLAKQKYLCFSEQSITFCQMIFIFCLVIFLEWCFVSKWMRSAVLTKSWLFLLGEKVPSFVSQQGSRLESAWKTQRVIIANNGKFSLENLDPMFRLLCRRLISSASKASFLKPLLIPEAGPNGLVIL